MSGLSNFLGNVYGEDNEPDSSSSDDVELPEQDQPRASSFDDVRDSMEALRAHTEEELADQPAEDAQEHEPESGTDDWFAGIDDAVIDTPTIDAPPTPAEPSIDDAPIEASTEPSPSGGDDWFAGIDLPPSPGDEIDDVLESLAAFEDVETAQAPPVEEADHRASAVAAAPLPVDPRIDGGTDEDNALPEATNWFDDLEDAQLTPAEPIDAPEHVLDDRGQPAPSYAPAEMTDDAPEPVGLDDSFVIPPPPASLVTEEDLADFENPLELEGSDDAGPADPTVETQSDPLNAAAANAHPLDPVVSGPPSGTPAGLSRPFEAARSPDEPPSPVQGLPGWVAPAVEVAPAETPTPMGLTEPSWEPVFDDIIPGKETPSAALRMVVADETVASVISVDTERRRARRGRRAVDDTDNPVIEPKGRARRRKSRRDADPITIDIEKNVESVQPTEFPAPLTGEATIDLAPPDEDEDLGGVTGEEHPLGLPIDMLAPPETKVEDPSEPSEDATADDPLVPPDFEPPESFDASDHAEPIAVDEALRILAPPSEIESEATNGHVTEDDSDIDIETPDTPVAPLDDFDAGPSIDDLSALSVTVDGDGEASEADPAPKERRRGLLGRRSNDDARNPVPEDEAEPKPKRGRRRSKRRSLDAEMADMPSLSNAEASEIMGLAPLEDDAVAGIPEPTTDVSTIGPQPSFAAADPVDPPSITDLGFPEPEPATAVDQLDLAPPSGVAVDMAPPADIAPLEEAALGLTEVEHPAEELLSAPDVGDLAEEPKKRRGLRRRKS